MEEDISINEAVETVIKIGQRYEQQIKLAESVAVADRERRKRQLSKEATENRIGSRA